MRHFLPNVLVVQAGAGAHFDDPLADLMLRTQDYEAIFRRILEEADLYTQGRVLFTLGGGYSLNAVPRVWALLYLLLHDLPIPSELPNAWWSKWNPTAAGKLPRTIHDPVAESAVPRRQEIEQRNRQVVHRLLDVVARYWF